MHRIDTSTAQVDKFGAGKNGFTGGNPQTGELPTALDADFFDSVQEEIASLIEAAGISLSKASNNQLLSAVIGLVGPGRLLNVQTFKSSGVYTPTPGTKKVRVKMTGGGGAGGGTAPTSSSQIASGVGGNSGTYSESIMIDIAIASGAACIVGTAGVGSPGATGGNGGASSFGSILFSPGGAGGSLGTAGGAGTAAPDLSSGTPGSGSALSFTIPGGGGTGPFNISAVSAGTKSGRGGDGQYGQGGASINGTISPRSATGYGAGGGGNAAGPGALTAIAGGSGSGGLVIVEEYS